jgi:serine/threonine protein phosphatase PrpC
MSISAFGSTHIGGASNHENQDTFFVRERIFGIFDGHGQAGRKMAETARDLFQDAPLDASFPITFAQVEEAVRPLVPPHTISGGGTTASVLYIDPLTSECHVGHVGDSEVRYYDTDKSEGVSLTTDHSACSLEEFLRVKTIPDPGSFEFAARSPYGPRPVFVQRAGVWDMNPMGGNMYCTVRGDWAAYLVSPDGERLAVTRALGDFHMKGCGVIAEPSVLVALPPAQGVTRAIVMASDGLWDAMKYEEVCAVVRAPEVLGNAEAATAALMAAAAAANAKHFGSSADNITAVVVYLTVPAAEPLPLLPTSPPSEPLPALPAPTLVPAEEDRDDYGYNDDERHDYDSCTAGWREGICDCCGSCTMFRDR